MLDFNKYKAITFDCYGTVIDWEFGITQSLQPILKKHNVTIPDEQLLEVYAEIEAECEKEFALYSEILRKVVVGLGYRYNLILDGKEINTLVDNFDKWIPFPDSIKSLKLFKTKYKIGPITNVDKNLFSITQRLLGIEFDYIITAEDVGSYKPFLENFKLAIQHLNRLGIKKEEILHIAQSHYHDIIPANQLGINTVWINRRYGKKGFGATPNSQGKPNIEVTSLESLVKIIGIN